MWKCTGIYYTLWGVSGKGTESTRTEYHRTECARAARKFNCAPSVHTWHYYGNDECACGSALSILRRLKQETLTEFADIVVK